MRILFICNEPIAGGIAHRLVEEGHDLKMYISHKDSTNVYNGIVPKTFDWREELDWVAKDGLIVFDDVGYGEEQDRLRRDGYTVYGGSYLGELLELNRELAAHYFEKHGLSASSMMDFNTPRDAMEYIKKNGGAWVVKQNNLTKKELDYIGQMENGRDTIAILERYCESDYAKNEKLTLQKTIKGIEVAVGRYFNGQDWVGPVGINFEHNRLFPGNLGPITSEMGTLMWYTNHEGTLYQKTVEPFTEYLRESDFRGCFDINCIVNEHGIFPIEATCRLGSPITYMHDELHETPWGEFLSNIASQTPFEVRWKEGYSIVVLVTVPTFPYKKLHSKIYQETEVFFDNLSESDMQHIHIEGLYTNGEKSSPPHYYVGDSSGYALCVTGRGDSPWDAQENTYTIVKKLVIPKMMYRNDIGDKFISEDLSNLLKWGVLTKEDLPYGRVPKGIEVKALPWWHW